MGFQNASESTLVAPKSMAGMTISQNGMGNKPLDITKVDDAENPTCSAVRRPQLNGRKPVKDLTSKLRQVKQTKSMSRDAIQQLQIRAEMNWKRKSGLCSRALPEKLFMCHINWCSFSNKREDLLTSFERVDMAAVSEIFL